MARKKTPPNLQEYAGMMKAFVGLDDRSLVLMSAAWVDDALEIFLKRRMLDDKMVIDKLFGPDRPLGSFSSRINLGYALGHIGKTVWSDLESVREIRNAFAHVRHALTFDDESIKTRSSQLKTNDLIPTPFRNSNESPKGLFSLCTIALIIYFLTLAETTGHPAESRDDAYQMSVNKMFETIQVNIMKDFLDKWDAGDFEKDK